jgi:hypothetical protein
MKPQLKRLFFCNISFESKHADKIKNLACSVIRGSQPFGFRVPPNGKLSVNLTFCVPPSVTRVPPGVRVPQVENRCFRLCNFGLG